MTMMLPASTSPTTPTGSVNPLAQLSRQKDDKKLLAWTMEKFNQAKNERSKTEQQWYLNLAFYFGKQNIAVINSAASSTSFQLVTPSAPPWRVRMVINKIRPIVRHELARLTSQKPIFTVIPNSTEDDDYSAARVGEQIFRAVYSDKQVSRELRRAAWWQIITGTGIIKNYWDPTKIDKASDAQGDFCIERINPFYLFAPDLEQEDIEDQPFIIHASTKSQEWVQHAFGTSVAPNASSTKVMEDGFLNLIGARQQRKDSVLCLEVWLKPGAHKSYPEGGLFTIIGDKVIRQSDVYPYMHEEYPFAKLDYVPSGKFYAESVLTDLIPIQKEINRTHSQIVESKNLMAKPRLLAARGSINPKQINSQPGQIILYTAGFNPPTPLPMDNLPPYVIQELQQLYSDMDDISAQHEISRGGAPSQVTAATAISYLQEQDDSKLATATASVEDCMQKIGRQVLHYATQFWNTERMVRVVGSDNAFEATHWKSEDLRGNTDLRVEAGSALPQSKAAKQAFVMDLLKIGFVDPQQGLELLDIGGIEKIYEQWLVDKRQAQRENLRMAELADNPQFQAAVQQFQQQAQQLAQMAPTDPQTGQPLKPQQPPTIINPNTFDNHQAHIMFHNQFRKSQQFEMLPDSVKQQFEAHVQAHQYASAMGASQTLPNGMAGPPMQQPGMMGQQPQQGPPQQQPGQQGPPQQLPPQMG